MITHILTHSLVVSIVRVAKEINNLEKNAEEFGGEGEKREERLNIRGFSFPHPGILFSPSPKQEKKRDAGRKEEYGNSVPPNAIYPMFDKYKAKFVAYSPPVRLSGIQEIFAFTFWNPWFWNPEFSSRNPESP